MASEARRELGRIKRASTALQRKLDSSEPAVVREAEAQLDEIAKALRVWARKHGVKLHKYVESHPNAEARRRRCKARFDTVIGDEGVTCFLIGREGRNCLYNCVPRLEEVVF